MSATTMRSGRVVKPPAHMKDYKNCGAGVGRYKIKVTPSEEKFHSNMREING